MTAETQTFPAGYKQTEIGVIPTDWVVKKLKDIAPLQRGFDLPTSQLKKGPYPVVYSNGILNFHYKAMVKAPGVVTGRSGTIGKVNYIEKDYWPHNTTLWVTDFKENDKKYIFFLYSYLKIERFSTGSGVPTLNRNDVHDFYVSIPRSKAEQTTIATALSDTNTLIEKLEKLIEKKKNIKQGAMQELLTGKKRLQGFKKKIGYQQTEIGLIPEDWTILPFGRIVSLRKEKYDSIKEGCNDFCVELEHIGQGTGRLIGHSITTESSSIKNVFKKDDVLFGRLRAYLKKYWKAVRNGVSSSEIWSLVANKQYTIPDYIFQTVQTDRFIQASAESYGTHMPRTDWNIIKKLVIALPSTNEEQTAIAKVLSDMDAEIEKLELQLLKYQNIKQGMMQTLLTGKIRLVTK